MRLTRAEKRILAFLKRHPNKYYTIRAIAHYTRYSYSYARRILRELYKKGLISRKVEWILKPWFYRVRYAYVIATYHYVLYLEYSEAVAKRKRWARRFEYHILTHRKLLCDEIIDWARDDFVRLLGWGYDYVVTPNFYKNIGVEILPFKLKHEYIFIIDLQGYYPPYLWMLREFDREDYKKLIDYRRSYIGIDLDDKTEFEMLGIVARARGMLITKDVKIWKTKKGYHLRIIPYEPMKFKAKMKVRKELEDDKMRMAFDKIKYNIDKKLEITTDVLFKRKYEYIKGEWKKVSEEEEY